MSRIRRIALACLFFSSLPFVAHAACDRRIGIERSPDVNAGSGHWANFTLTDADPACVKNVEVEFTLRESSSTAELWLDERTPSSTPRRAVVRTDEAGNGRIHFVTRDSAPFSIQATVVLQPNVGEIVTPAVRSLAPALMSSESRPIAARPGAAFASDLAVRVYGAIGVTPVGNQTVTFAAPATGATALFPNGQHTVTILANPFGLASTPIAAGTETGSFTVTITVAAAQSLRLDFAVGDASATHIQLPQQPGVIPNDIVARVALAGLGEGVPLPPLGTVRFLVDNVPTAPRWSRGIAGGMEFGAPLPRQSLGTHAVMATYSGDAVFAASNSDVVSFEVKPDWQAPSPAGPVALKVFPGYPEYHVCPLQAASVWSATDASLPAPPSISRFPGGVIEYLLSDCWPGHYTEPSPYMARVLLRFENDVDPDAVVWQYSYTASGPQWHAIDASIQGNEVMVQFDRWGGDDRSRYATGHEDLVHGYLAVGTRPPQWPPNIQDLWWAGPAENGWGMTISQREDRLFVGLFAYDESGAPRWYVLSGGTWDASRQAFAGNLYQPTGPSWRAYKPGMFDVGAPVGNASLRFTDRDHAAVSFEIGGVHVEKSIQRQLFGPPGLIQPPGAGLWWALYDEPGWGLAVAQQGTKRFAVWFTYDDEGKTTWMVAPDLSPLPLYGVSEDSSAGALYATRGSAWLGRTYAPAALVVTELATLMIGFSASGNSGGMLVTQGEQRLVEKALARQPF